MSTSQDQPKAFNRATAAQRNTETTPACQKELASPVGAAMTSIDVYNRDTLR